ncbi:MAG: type II toxin-antitoxin system antitoxin DNA ADP-ribosyl glycohydrolase DarG [Fluviibacter sp.]
MIELVSGNILEDESDAIVNTVNCVGVMGRGIALQFKNAWPKNFKAYEAACKREEVLPGRMFVYETGQLSGPKFIINFPTKRHWRGKSHIQDVVSGLQALVKEIEQRGIRSIAVPPLGSGLGGLNWKEVLPLIEKNLGSLSGVRVRVYEPANVASELGVSHKRAEPPNMTAGRAALVGLTHRYMGGLLDPVISLLELHKLMYFLQEAGEPLRLKYVRAPYGPYAENLRHALRTVEGYLLTGYSDGGDAPDKPLGLVPGAIDDAWAFLETHQETKARFDRVASLVEGFETPFGLELLATVHWVSKNELTRDLDCLVRHVYAWNDRKKQFTSRQIGIAQQVLVEKGWIQ